MAQWLVAAKRADFQKMAEQYKIDPVVARLIRNRDVVGDEEIRKYLDGGVEDLYSPTLLKDMDRAVEVLKDKIASGAKIRIIGDYDADGICASYVLLKGLSVCGARADTVIPHRVKDGYGLNESLLEDAAKDGVDTVVTCDNGIAAAAQIAYGRQLGLTVVVTDHHEILMRKGRMGAGCTCCRKRRQLWTRKGKTAGILAKIYAVRLWLINWYSSFWKSMGKKRFWKNCWK